MLPENLYRHSPAAGSSVETGFVPEMTMNPVRDLSDITCSVCGASTCSHTPTTALDYLAYKWKVQAMVGGVWKSYSAFKTFTVKVPAPTPQTPSGTISDTTPTYKWTKVTGATQYRYQLMQNTTVVYTKTVGSAVCGASTCSHTPATPLEYLAYKWKVQAQVGGVWSDYSQFKTFTVASAITKPKAGFWQESDGLAEIYVTTNQTNVDEFAIYIDWTGYGCSTYKITHNPLEPIANNKFSFTGSFYASGTFNTSTSAAGTVGLNNFLITGCGYVNGSASWTADWKNTNQPFAIVTTGGEATVINEPTLQGSGYQTFEVITP